MFAKYKNLLYTNGENVIWGIGVDYWNFNNPQGSGHKSYLDILQEQQENMKSHPGDKKVKKFFRFAVPVLILEVLIAAALIVYFVLLPKNFCYVSINNKDAVVYINDKETSKFRMKPPKESINFYYYAADVCVELPAGDDYIVVFTIECDKYRVDAATSAKLENKTYSMQVDGGVKTQILSGFTIVSSKLIKDFQVDIKINVQKT